MNQDLFRRLERLEARVATCYEPLVIVAGSLPSEYVLAPGERIVTDTLQRTPLVVVVSGRVTADRNDPGRGIGRKRHFHQVVLDYIEETLS